MKRKAKVVWSVMAILTLLAVVGLLLLLQHDAPAPPPPQTGPPPTSTPPPLPPTLPRTAPPPISIPQERSRSIDQILEEMEFGRIAFNAPESINVEETAIVHLVLGVAQEMEELKQLVEAEGRREGARIRVSDRMEARLTGPNFAITAITPELQAVSHNEVTEWKWEVKPRSEGQHSLHLTLSALIRFGDTATPRAIRTFDKMIAVEVTWPQRIGSFFERNWQWLWAALLAPIAGWLWRRKKKADKG